MMVARELRAAALMVLLGGCAWGQVTLPALHGTTLSGETVDLPQAAKGKVGVLVLGFSQGSREQVTAWGKRLSADFRDSNAVLYYEMPILAGIPKLLRGMVVKKIAADVPDRARARFLPIYDHEADLRKLAGYEKGDDAYTLLLDASGAVVWKGQGAPSDATYAEMKRRIGALTR
jgi:hypothetical protein